MLKMVCGIGFIPLPPTTFSDTFYILEDISIHTVTLKSPHSVDVSDNKCVCKFNAFKTQARDGGLESFGD